VAELLNRPDFRPYCLYHAVPMTADSEGETASPQTSVQAFTCRFAGCDLNWERRLGYFKTTTIKSTFQFGIGGKRCSIPQHAFLAISRFSAEGRIWSCAVEGCNHMEVDPSRSE
jgi:hypothetical protein